MKPAAETGRVLGPEPTITVEKAPDYSNTSAHEHLATVEKLAAEAEAAGNTEAVAGFAIVRERLLADIATLNGMN